MHCKKFYWSNLNAAQITLKINKKAYKNLKMIFNNQKS